MQLFNKILLVDDDSATNYLSRVLLTDLDAANEIDVAEDGLIAFQLSFNILDFLVEQPISFIIRNYYKRLYMKKQYFLPLLIIGVLVAALASYCSKGSSYGSSSNNNNTPANNNTVTM